MGFASKGHAVLRRPAWEDNYTLVYSDYSKLIFEKEKTRCLRFWRRKTGKKKHATNGIFLRTEWQLTRHCFNASRKVTRNVKTIPLKRTSSLQEPTQLLKTILRRERHLDSEERWKIESFEESNVVYLRMMTLTCPAGPCAPLSPFKPGNPTGPRFPGSP